MPNLTSKKTKTLNSNSLIKNQITNILQPVNGTIAIKQPTNTILTQNAVSQSYYIPLLEKITGEQSINVRANLSFDATTNTLSVPNLTISNLPTCNVSASNSSDLVNKSYANTYAYFDLSGGDRWECEDWISGTTKGKYNWELYTNNVLNTNSATMITFPNTIGVLSLYSQGSNARVVSSPFMYNTSKLKSLRFIVRIATEKNTDFRIGLFDNKLSSLRYGDYNSNNNIGFRISSVNSTNSTLMRIRSIINKNIVNTFTSDFTADVWVLLEIRKSSNNVTFLVNNLTSNITYTNFSTTLSSDFDGYISMYFESDTATANSRYAYIDYIDWVVSS
jgi:hypothetical protein